MKQKNKNEKEIRLRNGYEDMKGLTISLHKASEELVCHFDMQADVRL